MKDEVEYDSENFHNVYSIILDLHQERSWDPDRDSFYPLTLKLIEDQVNRDINDDYPIRIDLSHPGVALQKDRPQRLFPIGEEEE